MLEVDRWFMVDPEGFMRQKNLFMVATGYRLSWVVKARFVQNVTTKDRLTLCWFPSPTSPSSNYDVYKKGSGVSSLKLLHADWRHGG